MKNYKEFLNEKISDKLSGFNEQSLKQQFLNGEIQLNKYIDLCKKHHIEFPTNDEVKIALNNQFKHDNNINIAQYIKYCEEHNIELPTNDEMKKYMLSGNILLNIYLYICKEYKFQLPTEEEKHQIVSNYKDYNSMMIDACRYGYLDLVKKSIEQGSKYYKNSFDPIRTAIEQGYYEIVKYLVELGIGHNFLDDALTYAAEYDQYEIVKYLLEHGAIVYYKTTKNLLFGKTYELLKKYYDKQHDK